MKVIKIPVDVVDLSKVEEASPEMKKAGMHQKDVLELIILASPPEGLKSDTLLKTGELYLSFREAAKKAKAKKQKNWIWYIDKDQYQVFRSQLDVVRWNGLSGELRVLLMNYIKVLRELKEEEVDLPTS